MKWIGPENSGPLQLRPDGDKIAFLSQTDPEGETLEGGPAVFVTNVDGSSPVQITNPEIAVPVSAPTFSPDGSHIAVSAFGEFNEWEEGDLVSVSLGAEGLTQLTSIPEGIAWEPDWLPDGRIVFTEEHWSSAEMEFLSVPGEGGEVQQLHPPFTNGEFGYHIAGRQPVDWEPMTSESIGLATQLLHLYAPTLKYDTTETYRAVAVNSIFQTYSGSEPEDSNQLLDSEGEVIQYANPKLNPLERHIWLAGQGEEYFTDPEVLADESHRLDERNGSYAEDAAPWQEDTYYGDTSYGRAVYAEGHWWLQYWFWYYYDEFNLLGFGDHEGDWELIQIQLDENGNPQSTTYAQHGDSEADTCNFDVLDWTVGRVPNVSPIAYVGTGTHASFVRPGLAVGSFPYDRADGEGYVARLRMTEMFEVWTGGSVGGTYARDWPLWPGRWGSSLGEGKSPMAPRSQGEKWDQPGGFAEQTEECPEEDEGEPQARIQGGMSSRPNAPQAPAIRAQLRGHDAVVHYELSGAPAGRKQGVEIAVLADRAVVTPVKRAAWKREGTLKLPLPNGEGPYTIVARSLLSNGAGSPNVTVEIGSQGSDLGRAQQARGPRSSVSESVYGDVLFDSEFVQRLGTVQAKALRRRERRLGRVDKRIRRTSAPAVVRALGDREIAAER